MVSAASNDETSVPSTSADIAFSNIGGLRDSLLFAQYYAEGDGVVTFEKAQAVMPFKNKVEILQCTGAQIIAAVQQNVYVQPGGTTKLLQVSSGFALAGTQPTYRVGITDFVGNGGDGYTAFRGCTVSSVVGVDLAAFTAYLGAHMPLAPPAANRITKL